MKQTRVRMRSNEKKVSEVFYNLFFKVISGQSVIDGFI